MILDADDYETLWWNQHWFEEKIRVSVDHADVPGQPNGRLAHEDAWTRWCPLCIETADDEERKS